MLMNLSEQLTNLESKKMLHAHDALPAEIKQHIDKADTFLKDARKKDNAPETRFSMANTAGHMLLMAAIKTKGYRPTSEKDHRAILYQILDTLLPGAAKAQVTLSKAHNLRNRSEYDGDDIEVTQGQLDDTIAAVASVKEEVDLLYKKYKAEHEAKK
jgi:hypothetical protein